jgi:endoglucanase
VERRQLHWVFGENPFGISFLVGAGTAWPQNVHHAFGQAAHAAIPGALAGGPTALRVLEHSKLPLPPKDDPFAMWSTDDLLYEDKAEDYVCNEPAIDFAAALVFTLAEMADAS